jgi:DNA-binding winged helix-turn-helix (wHTH) protein/tetratricopeptide (TPR) repeat protein
MTSPAADSVASVELGFTFGSFRLEPDGTLLRGKAPVHIPLKELAALRFLLQHAGQIVTAKQLREALWGDVNVTADSVPRCISSLRAILDSDDCIETVYKQGYRLTGPVQRDRDPSESSVARLAIVPFACGENVPEHLGRAVSEEATAQLTAMRPQMFSMLARDSVFTLARTMSAQQVGETLNADLVLTGTVHGLGSQLRLRVEMVRINEGTQIWVEELLVGRERVAELAEQLVERLMFRGGGVAREAAPEDQRSGLNGQAYELFLRGRYGWQSLQRHRMQEGTRYLQQAADLEPRLTQARVDTVRACVAQELFGYISPIVAAEQVRRIAEELREDPMASKAICPARGWMSFHVDRDPGAAVGLFTGSEDLPFDPWHTRVRALFAASRHRFDEAAQLLREALNIDPYSPWLNAALAWVYHLSGNREDSMRQIGRCLELVPNHTATRLYGGVILAFNGEAERAIELTRELARRTPDFDMAMAVHAYALARHGEREPAAEWLERLQWLGRERFVMRSFAVAAYLVLGDVGGAMSELHAADEDRCPWFLQMLADPRLADLRDVPEFREMRRRHEEMETAAAEAEQESLSEFSEK